MFSKSGFVSLFLATVLILTASCTPEVGEQPPVSESFELASTKCFNKAADNLRLFFFAEATDEMLASSWGCIETAFIQFEKYIKSSNPEGYTSQEIVTFLEKHFFEDKGPGKRTISVGLQAELMKLKRIFIGGNAQFVTREELRNSRSFLQKMSVLTRTLNPFMKIVVMKWKPDVEFERPEDLKAFEDSNVALQTFAKEVAEIIKTHEGEYSLADAIQLCREFENYFGQKWDWVQDAEKALPGVKKLKVTLAGGQENLITNQEWVPVLTLGARGYYQFLRYQYFIKSTPQTGGGVRLVYITKTIEDVLSIFQDLLSQRSDKVITRKEIFEILNGFGQVWENLRVSENLIIEYMKIKRALVGGDVDHLTVQDFENARLKVPHLRRIVENFLPYLNIYMSDWDPNFESAAESRKVFADAARKLVSVAKDLGQFIEADYSYNDLLKLLKEVDALPISKDDGHRTDHKLYESMKKYEDVVVQINKTLFGRADSVLTKGSWEKILPLAARAYSVFQYYDYFVKAKEVREASTLDDLEVLVDNGIEFTKSVLALKNGGRLNQSELVQISLSLSRAEILPSEIRNTTYESVWTALLQHLLFDPQRRIAGEKNNQFGIEQLQILKKEFRNWKTTQKVLNELFQGSPQASYTAGEMISQLQKEVAQAGENLELRSGLQGVLDHLDSTVSQTLDADNQMQISGKVKWEYRWNALFQANLSRVIAKVLIQGFAGEKQLKRVTECETKSAFYMLVDALRDLKLFDLKDDFIDSRFLEANIFMSRGNGDNFLDLHELSELTTVIFSGLEVNVKMEKSLREYCPVMKDKDDREFVFFNCISEHHYIAVRKFMVQMPEFKSYVDNLAAQDRVPQGQDEFSSIRERPGFQNWNSVFRATLKAAGWKPNKGYGGYKQESVYLGDALYYPFVIHYIELLYARFDTNKDNILQTNEAKRAFPTFKPLLKELAKSQIASGLIKEADLLAVFTFILRYQEEPGLKNVFRWLTWKANPSKWDVWVGRTQMAQILGFIADKAAAAAAGDVNKCKGLPGKPTRQMKPKEPNRQTLEEILPEEPFQEFSEDQRSGGIQGSKSTPNWQRPEFSGDNLDHPMDEDLPAFPDISHSQSLRQKRQ